MVVQVRAAAAPPEDEFRRVFPPLYSNRITPTQFKPL